MTQEEQKENLSKAYDLLTEAHDLILDVHLFRREQGEIIEGDAISASQGKIRESIDALRNTGDITGYYPDWERPE
ncbi:hypothetical protein AAFN60_21370 [Roseibacillus persicicus]|uniref:hypothetical protein n=1 Tax=Roseibacillus persicicus TaxID=454148 RepID=UPI00398A8531